MTTGAPPHDTVTIPHPGRLDAGTRRRLPACPCYYVGIGYIVCLPSLYMRGLGYRCPIRTQLLPCLHTVQTKSNCNLPCTIIFDIILTATTIRVTRTGSV